LFPVVELLFTYENTGLALTIKFENADRKKTTLKDKETNQE